MMQRFSINTWVKSNRAAEKVATGRHHIMSHMPSSKVLAADARYAGVNEEQRSQASSQETSLRLGDMVESLPAVGTAVGT